MNKLPRILGITALLMVLPLIGSLTAEGWGWTGFDYVVAAIIFFCVVSLLEYGLSRSGNFTYRVGFGIAVLAGFMLFWGNAATGMIGEDNPGNLAYVLLLFLSFIGAALSKFRARGLAKTMFWTAFGMLAIPTIVFTVIGGKFPESPEPHPMARTFAISAFFAAAFVGSGLLFRRAGQN